MKKQVFFLLSMFAFLLSNCRELSSRSNPTIMKSPLPLSTEPAESKSIDISQITVHNYPRVDGSTSAHPLQVMLACRILGVPCVWYEGDPFDPTRRMIPDLDFKGSEELVERIFGIQHHGTHDAYMNLIHGNAEIILVARQPSTDELQAAQLRGVELEVTPIALDAFVFLINKENPVEDLTLESIRSIYMGEVTQWAEIEGSEGEIHTYRRNRNSGSQELMEKLVMRGTPMVESPEMILMSMIGPINAISEDPLGIGYSVYFYTAFMYPHEKIKMIAIDGVPPTSTTIAELTYPLTTEVYAVIRSDTSQQSTAPVFLEWLFTGEGKEAIAESGYVPIND
jgi:phosphate transport system substrate-binding protein